MINKSLVYVSDQKYYKSKDGAWYTTASFPKEVIDTFLDINEWTFFGRLYNCNDVTNLFKLEFDNNIKITFDGIWDSKPGLNGYFKNFLNLIIKAKSLNLKYDIFYLKFSFIYSYIIGLILKSKGKLVISHLVGDFETIIYFKKSLFYKFLVFLQRFLYTIIIKKVHLQIYVSEKLCDKYSIPGSEKLVMCESRVSINEFKFQERSYNKRLNLVFVGRLSPEKGIFDLLESIISIEDINLDIIGSGPLDKSIENFIEANNLTNRVNLLGYIKWGEGLLYCFKNYDYLVLPSYIEGLPLVIIEAMSQGLPVIASDVGGISEIVINEFNGILFEAGNIQELKTKLENLTKNRNIMKIYQENGKEFIKKYSLENQVLKLRDKLEILRLYK